MYNKFLKYYYNIYRNNRRQRESIILTCSYTKYKKRRKTKTEYEKQEEHRKKFTEEEKRRKVQEDCDHKYRDYFNKREFFKPYILTDLYVHMGFLMLQHRYKPTYRYINGELQLITNSLSLFLH